MSNVHPPFRFRAVWPITDPSCTLPELALQAEQDLLLLKAQAKAQTVGPGRYFVDSTVNHPVVGNLTATVLVYEAPARERVPFRVPVVERTSKSPARPGKA